MYTVYVFTYKYKYCGGACTPHLPEVSCHYRVVVKSFASGQCGPGSIPGRFRSWSDAYSPPNQVQNGQIKYRPEQQVSWKGLSALNSSHHRFIVIVPLCYRQPLSSWRQHQRQQLTFPFLSSGCEQ